MRQLLFQIFLLIAFILNAQDPIHYHLTEKDGLPDIEFYNIIEDEKGYIWLAADRGLYRYDGKTFKNYSNPKKRGLSVFGLKFDAKGKLWCNNISGQYFYVENDSLKLFTDLKNHTKGQLSKFIFFENKLIVHNNLYGFEVDLNTKKTKPVFKKSTHSVEAFYNKDTLFYIHNNKIKYKTKLNKNLVTKSNLKLFRENSTDRRVYKIGSVFFLHSINKITGGQKIYLRKNNRFKELTTKDLNLKSKLISIFYEKDLFWFCTDDGIYKFSLTNNVFKLESRLFKGEIVTNILKDKNQNYWVTTLRKGIFILPNIYVEQIKLQENDNISALEKLDSTTFVYGNTKGVISLVSNETVIAKNVDNYNQKVNKIAYNGLDKILVSFDEKESILNRKNLKSFKTSSNLNLRNAKGITVINQNQFLLGRFASVDLFNLKENSFLRLGNRRSYTTHYNKNIGDMYVGYVDGVEYYLEDLKPNSIQFKDNPIFAIDIDNTSDNTVWISTFSDGIIGIKNGKAIYNYTTETGLLSNQTGTIKADGTFLWIVTDKGLQRFNTQTKEFQNLTEKDGITSFNISDILVFKDKIIFGSNKGLFQVDKNNAFKKRTLPGIYFTEILIEDEKRPVKDNYILESNQNKIEIKFHANGYLTNQNIIYKYRLLGANNNWYSLTNGVNEVVFNSLSPGKYIFQLKGVEVNSKEETKTHIISIHVKLPFYKEWWFIVGLILIILLVILKCFLWYIKRLKARQKEKLEKERINKRLIAFQLESLRSQMNPHFIFNALNSIQEYIVLNEKKLASIFLVKFSRLIRMYLEHSQKQYITLSEEIDALKLYLQLEKDRFEEALHYTMHVSNKLNTKNIKVPSIFIQPYVENALKHGLLHKKSNRELTISFYLEQNNVICCIEDNGVGREASKKIKEMRGAQHKSYATKANQKRLDLINTDRTKKIDVSIIDLYSNNKEATGTKVVVKIPIG